MKKTILFLCLFTTLGFSLTQAQTTGESFSNISTDKQEKLQEIKENKINKISQVESKLGTIIPKAESINYDTRELRVYKNNLSKIKNKLDKSRRIVEIKKYNIQLKGTMNGIRQELSDLKHYYKNR